MSEENWDRERSVTIHDYNGRSLSTTAGEWGDALTREMHRENERVRKEREEFGRAKTGLERGFEYAFMRAFNRLASKA